MCTNEKELCGFMTNNLEPKIPMGIHKCDNCQDGFLIVQKGNNKFEHGSPYYLKCTQDCKNSDGKPYRISEAKYRRWLNGKGFHNFVNYINSDVLNKQLAAHVDVVKMIDKININKDK